MPLTSIIVVSYNNGKHIRNCLDSVYSLKSKDYETIVVDNASSPEFREIIKQTFPDVSLIENDTNLGFSKALNQGIAKASGDLILCLNDDIKLADNFLEAISDFIKDKDKAAAVQPKVLKEDGRTVDTLGIHLSFLRRFHDLGRGRVDREKFVKGGKIFGACAAAVLYRKKALEEIRQDKEYFDEDFFCIAEDLDVSWRLKKQGWESWYCPEAVCTHLGGISRKAGYLNRFLSLRNRYLLLIKNESVCGLLKLPFVFIAYDLWRNLYIILRDPGCFFKAMRSALSLSPRMFRKRTLSRNSIDV